MTTIKRFTIFRGDSGLLLCLLCVLKTQDHSITRSVLFPRLIFNCSFLASYNSVCAQTVTVGSSWIQCHTSLTVRHLNKGISLPFMQLKVVSQ